jgi:hypothetical protein
VHHRRHLAPAKAAPAKVASPKAAPAQTAAAQQQPPNVLVLRLRVLRSHEQVHRRHLLQHAHQHGAQQLEARRALGRCGLVVV